jgi:hypothetical protein
MKRFLLTTLIALIFLIAGYLLGRKTSPTSPCPDCSRAFEYLYRYDTTLVAEYQENLAHYTREKARLSPAQALVYSGPMQFDHADHYVTEFQKGGKQVRDDMKNDREETFHFDENTLGTFSALFCQNKIDGFRVYLAKYNPTEPNDAANRGKSNYTVILVGTKRVMSPQGQPNYQDVKIPVTTALIPGTYLSIQDYSNPCRPPDNCSGDGLILGN